MVSALKTLKIDLKSDAARSFRYTSPVDAIEWSETKRRMEGGRRFKFSYAPYEREMMDTIYSPDVQLTVFMMASRLGKTEVVMNAIGHAIEQSPRRILVMYPTVSQAEKWSKETLNTELIQPTPTLTNIFGNGSNRRLSSNTILHKQFPGGLLNAFGANSPGEMRRAKGNFLFADEIDSIQESEGDEGDPLEIFWIRGSEYDDSIKVAASYPSVTGRSRIETLMNQSDFRQWFVECPHCDHEYVLHRKQLIYDKTDPESAIMVCPAGGCKITDAERVTMAKGGEWRPTRPFTGIAGFQANRMISPHPVQKGFKSHLHWCAVEELKAAKAANPDRAMRVIVNTFDSECYTPPSEEKPAVDTLYQKREAWNPDESIPAGVLCIVAAADIQGNRIEIEFIGAGENDETWGLGYKIVHGSPHSQKTWNELDRVVTSATWKHADGAAMQVSAFGIDSGWPQTEVLKYTLPRQGRRVFATKGARSLGAPLIPQRSTRIGRALQWSIGTHEAKDLIYQRLRLEKSSDASDFPRGYMHYPEIDDYSPTSGGEATGYFEMLTAEDSTLKKANTGDDLPFFTCARGKRNEALDVRVIGLATVKLLNPNWEVLKAGRIRTPEKPKTGLQVPGKMPAKKRWI
jgi:phage terminase large subunit GpA-like protein